MSVVLKIYLFQKKKLILIELIPYVALTGKTDK